MKGGRTPSAGAGGPPRRSPRLTASAGAKPRLSVQQLRRQRRAAAAADSHGPLLDDPLAPCDAAAAVRRGPTGLVYDDRLLEHRCPWDADHPESPARLQAVFDRCSQLGLVERCLRVPTREATDDELQTCHSAQHVQTLRQLCQNADPDRLKQEAERRDSIYFHPATFRCASLAAGATLDLADQILDGTLQNGFALVRPPGHHAMADEYNGYSYFNHVALAAHRAADRGRRVLIVDWDVHHGQGTQQAFYDDDRVLYFSTHRFDGGAFWPHLAESDFDRVGAGPGAGFTWNVPLEAAASDADLLAVWHRLLLPAAYEFAPDLVIVSAGFDAALGDPKGGLRVTPACFGHLTHALLCLSAGRLLAVLEGGYCLSALSQSAAHTLQALLGDPAPPLAADLPPPSPSLENTIRNVICSHRPYFHCFSHYDTFSVLEEDRTEEGCHWPPSAASPAGPDQDADQAAADAETAAAVEQLNRLLLAPPPAAPAHQLCLATSDQMMRHRNVSEPGHPERPERLRCILSRLADWGLTERCWPTPGRRRADADHLLAVHEPAHLAAVADTAGQAQRELDRTADRYNSVYLCPDSYDCALLAAGCVIEAVDSVLSGESGRGVCVVRPPGHHAEPDTAHGFCLFNNVAVAARHACRAHGLSRVLVVDWDVHHGNGIQHMFYSDRDVLYVSLHRHDHGFFFPMSDDGDHDRVGEGAGRGFNVNVPWNRARMGGAEYLAALLAVVLPVAYQFSPQLVLVSAGFDAARGDPLGGYAVPPEVFGHMTHHLAALAGGRLVMALEGGYNLTSIAYSMGMCVRALLGEPPVQLAPLGPVNESAARSLRAVAASQRPFWPAVAELRRLPAEPLEVVRRVLERRRAAERAETAGTQEQATDAPQKAADAPEDEAERAAAEGAGEGDGGRPPLESMLDALSLDQSGTRPAGEGDGQTAEQRRPAGAVHPAVPGGHSAPDAAAVLPSEAASEAVERPTAPAPGPPEMAGVPAKIPCASEEVSPKSVGKSGKPEEVAACASDDPERAAVSKEEEVAGAAGSLVDDSGVAELLMLQEQFESMYAVIPLPSCPHLCTVAELPDCGIDAAEPCTECGDTQENWVCLTCYQVLCGRYRACHMLDHGAVSGHCMVLSLADLSVWCYICEAYVHNERLIEAKRSAHRSKFGMDMPA